jgi:RecA/RadA recombinase
MTNPERKDGNPKRQEILENVLKQIQKTYGEGAIMRLGEKPVAEVEVIPTGSLALDIALGVGGVPRGRIVEIFGPGGLGKNHPRPPHRGRGPEARRHRCLHRC